MYLNWGFRKIQLGKKIQLGNRFREKNQHNANRTQIFFLTFNSFQVWYDMNFLNPNLEMDLEKKSK